MAAVIVKLIDAKHKIKLNGLEIEPGREYSLSKTEEVKDLINKGFLKVVRTVETPKKKTIKVEEPVKTEKKVEAKKTVRKRKSNIDIHTSEND